MVLLSSLDSGTHLINEKGTVSRFKFCKMVILSHTIPHNLTIWKRQGSVLSTSPTPYTILLKSISTSGSHIHFLAIVGSVGWSIDWWVGCLVSWLVGWWGLRVRALRLEVSKLEWRTYNKQVKHNREEEDSSVLFSVLLLFLSLEHFGQSPSSRHSEQITCFSGLMILTSRQTLRYI